MKKKMANIPDEITPKSLTFHGIQVRFLKPVLVPFVRPKSYLDRIDRCIDRQISRDRLICIHPELKNTFTYGQGYKLRLWRQRFVIPIVFNQYNFIVLYDCRVQILKTKLVVSLGNSKQNLKNRVVKDFMMSQFNLEFEGRYVSKGRIRYLIIVSRVQKC